MSFAVGVLSFSAGALFVYMIFNVHLSVCVRVRVCCVVNLCAQQTHSFVNAKFQFIHKSRCSFIRCFQNDSLEMSTHFGNFDQPWETKTNRLKILLGQSRFRLISESCQGRLGHATWNFKSRFTHIRTRTHVPLYTHSLIGYKTTYSHVYGISMQSLHLSFDSMASSEWMDEWMIQRLNEGVSECERASERATAEI